MERISERAELAVLDKILTLYGLLRDMEARLKFQIAVKSRLQPRARAGEVRLKF